jgi:uncharacterized membrane protein YfhO
MEGPDIWVYQNEQFSGYPYLLGVDGQTHPVTLKSFSANRVEYQVSGKGVLKTSDLMYPGWRALLDGQSVPMNTDDGLFRSINIPEGNHVLQMEYHPLLTYLGITIALITLLLMMVNLKDRT